MQHILAFYGGNVLENNLKKGGCAKLTPLGKNGSSVTKDSQYVQLISMNILALVFIGKIQMFLVRDSQGDRATYNSRKSERPRSRGRSSIAATYFKVKCVI